MVINYDKTKAAEVCGEALAALKEVFDLPLETKMKNKYKKPLIGYVGQIPKLPLHESMGIDNAVDADAVSAFTDLMWPDHGNPSFRYFVLYFSAFIDVMNGCISNTLSTIYVTHFWPTFTIGA
ncbi:Probable 2-oxoglutarate-dependent dioxygenase AOP1.2 [Linum perenne]